MLLFAPLFLVAAAQMLPLASRLRPIILAGRAPAKIVGKVARTTVKAATRKSTSDLLDMHALIEDNRSGVFDAFEAVA